jgi:hypothetical protein
MIRIYVFCSLLILLFFNCKNEKSNDFGNQVQYDAALTDSFFFQNEWSYPSMTSKISEGKFDNGYGEKISTKDTLHLWHTAAIVTLFDSLYKEGSVRQDCFDCQIDFGEAHLVKDSLMLIFYDATPSSFDDLEIKMANNSFSSTYINGAPAIGNRQYYFEKQELILQKQHYVKGDTIKGYLDLQGHSPKFVHLKGFFKVLVN